MTDRTWAEQWVAEHPAPATTPDPSQVVQQIAGLAEALPEGDPLREAVQGVLDGNS
jgi:hypothetical protein